MASVGEAIPIDGTLGEGGGQVLRTAVSLSAVTGTPVRVTNVRANRDKSGLRPQHLASVLAAARVCNGRVEGGTVGSTDVTFHPGDPAALRGGRFEFDVGTAGSAGLVCQTVLPILLRAAGPSEVVVTGGTHVPMAPAAPFLRHSFQRALRRLGHDVGFELQREGFHPAGGGRLVMRVDPTPRGELRRMDWAGRGRFVSLRCEVIYAGLPTHVATREMRVLRETLKSAGWPLPAVALREIEDADGPGNAVVVRAIYEEAEAVFTSIGQRGVRAEDVARDAGEAAVRWLMSGCPVDPHLADQLLIPLALAKGGRFVTPGPLDAHVSTNAEVIGRVLGATTRFTNHGDRVVVEVEPPEPASA